MPVERRKYNMSCDRNQLLLEKEQTEKSENLEEPN